MEFCQLDRIYHLIKNNNLEYAIQNYSERAVNTVLRLRFNNTAKLKNKVYSRKRIRPTQAKFSESVRKRCNHKCVITGETEIVQACHILEYKDTKLEKDENKFNGILLTNSLHEAFDKHHFIIDSKTCRVKIRKSLKIFDILKLKNGLYIPELNNPRSRNYLRLRNQLIKN